MKRLIAAAGLAVVSIIVIAGLGLDRAISQEVRDVFVRNFPELQRVEGEVKVGGTIRHSAFDRKERIVVAPARRNETSNLVSAGVVETDGFTEVVLSLQGEVRDTIFVDGKVGAVLIPDEEPILDALRSADRFEFPLEVTADVRAGGASFFHSEPVYLRVAFPRYRVYLYNSVNKSVEANLYVYMTN